MTTVPFDEVTWEYSAPLADDTAALQQWEPLPFPTPDWQFVVGPGASTSAPTERRILTEAYGRVVTWRARGYAVAQFTIDANSDEAQEIEPLVSDLWVRRDGDLLFRGRVTTPADEITEDTHTMQITAIDYRGMLGHRTTWTSTPTFEATAQAEIAWQIIQATQARTGGDWGITQGLSPAGANRDRNYPAMKNLRDLLDELADVEGGFEWEISPELELNVWTPRRGTDRGLVLDWGGVLSRVSGVLQPGGFGNAVAAIGSEATTPATTTDAGLSTDERGRWERVESFPTIEQQATLDARPAKLLDDALNLTSPLTLELAATRWGGREHVWLGDPVTAAINSGRFGSLSQRVMEVQAVCGDHGTETIRLGTVPA